MKNLQFSSRNEIHLRYTELKFNMEVQCHLNGGVQCHLNFNVMSVKRRNLLSSRDENSARFNELKIQRGLKIFI